MDHGGSDPLRVAVQGDGGLWEVDEVAGRARGSDGRSENGRLDLQSEMTGRVVQEILSNGTCGLPRLALSVAVHRPFIEALLLHWRRSGHPDAVSVPIT
jgi:hypothetical protein